MSESGGAGGDLKLAVSLSLAAENEKIWRESCRGKRLFRFENKIGLRGEKEATLTMNAKNTLLLAYLSHFRQSDCSPFVHRCRCGITGARIIR